MFLARMHPPPPSSPVPMRVENSEWYAALKRKKINGGRVPGFKSRKRAPQYFVCWRNQNKTGNAVYHQVSRKRGVVVITGTVKKEFRKPDETGCRWMLSITCASANPSGITRAWR